MEKYFIYTKIGWMFIVLLDIIIYTVAVELYNRYM